MKPGRLNALHRQVGIALAPFLLLQSLTGVLLSLQERSPAGRSAKSEGAWDVVAALHYAPGPIHRSYLLLLVAGIFWMIVTGSTLFLRVRRARAASAVATNRREPPSHDC